MRHAQFVREIVIEPTLIVEPLIQRDANLRRESWLSTETADSAQLELMGNQLAELVEGVSAMFSLVESLKVLHITSLENLTSRIEQVHRLTVSMYGGDPIAALQVFVNQAPSRAHRQLPEKTTFDPSKLLVELLASFSGTLFGIPTNRLVRALAKKGHSAVGHRLHAACERAQAIVTRNNDQSDERFVALGRAYAEGRLELSEIATIAGLPIPDVVATLERLSLTRSIARATLNEDRRQEILKRLEARRRASAAIEPSAAMIRRDVIATQRIENIDARPWLSIPLPE